MSAKFWGVGSAVVSTEVARGLMSGVETSLLTSLLLLMIGMSKSGMDSVATAQSALGKSFSKWVELAFLST